jgi:hypothetical protein
MKNTFFIFLLVLPLFSFAQQLTVLSSLSSTLEETSGLIRLGNKLITHNDSGGEPELYEFDQGGNVTRTVYVQNATNKDWEDLAVDSNFIYIADFGNNNGKRTDLKVYKIAVSSYLNTINDTVSADIINFAYADQTDFSSNSNTNFDAEGLIAFQDSLYIFTKNRGNNRTNIYPLSKSAGTYSIERKDSIDISGLITGATYNPISNMVVLSGYSNYIPFIVEISNFTNNDFAQGDILRYTIMPPLAYSTQIESIDYLDNEYYYLTGEENSLQSSALYKLKLKSATSIEEKDSLQGIIYPNPADDILYIDNIDYDTVEIYDNKGSLVLSSGKSRLNVSFLEQNSYLLLLKNTKGALLAKHILIIE